MNILEALKNYIRIHGGSSRANNISEAVKDLDSIPGGHGGDIPSEVTNAIETHGMGWTIEEVKEGFDIQWDGNTEGLESLADMLYLVSSVPTEITSVEDLIGATLVVSENGNFVSHVLTEDDIYTSDNKVYFCREDYAVVAFEDGVIPTTDVEVKKGIWFIEGDGDYVFRLYKEAVTEEVVHPIDQKYIGTRVVHFTINGRGPYDIVSDKTVDEVTAMFEIGVPMANIKKVIEGVTEREIYVPLQNTIDENENVIISATLFTIDGFEVTGRLALFSNAQKRWQQPAK